MMMSKHCSTVIRRTTCSIRSYRGNCSLCGDVSLASSSSTYNMCHYGGTFAKHIASLLTNATTRRASSTHQVYGAVTQQANKQQPESDSTYQSEVNDNTLNPISTSNNPAYQTQRISMVATTSTSTSAANKDKDSYFNNLRNAMNFNVNNIMMSALAPEPEVFKPIIPSSNHNQMNSISNDDNNKSQATTRSNVNNGNGNITKQSASEHQQISKLPQITANNNTNNVNSNGNNGQQQLKTMWTSNLSRSINWFYNQSTIDAAASKVS